VWSSPEGTLAGSIMSVEWPSSTADRARRRGSDPSNGATAMQLALLARLLDAPHSLSALRGTGSCVLDLAWVACGRLNVTYRGHVGCRCWDVCAGALLVEEGGGALAGPAGAADAFDLMSGQFVATGSVELMHEFQQCIAETREELGSRL
jgi:fructose-1,6-bisphosphatase/inositol monophosphatase family enzyme